MLTKKQLKDQRRVEYEQKRQESKQREQLKREQRIQLEHNLKAAFETNGNVYYDRAIEFWRKLPTLSANQWMNEYDAVFKYITHSTVDEDKYPELSNSQIVYDVYKRILEEEVGTFDTAEEYLARSQSFIRTTAYIHRFFVPNQDLTPLHAVAAEIAAKVFRPNKN